MPWPWDSRSPAEMGFGLRILPSPALVTPECYYYDFETIKSITLSETFAPRINVDARARRARTAAEMSTGDLERREKVAVAH